MLGDKAANLAWKLELVLNGRRNGGCSTPTSRSASRTCGTSSSSRSRWIVCTRWIEAAAASGHDRGRGG